MGKCKNYKQNHKFIDSAILNNATFIDYLKRFEKVARSIFEWVNLPKSMDSRWLERTLYLYGRATLLFDENFGFINTGTSTAGQINIYGLPTVLNCYSFEYNKQRKLYTGIDGLNQEQINNMKNTHCILVQNNWDGLPSSQSMELFALRLYEAERSIDTNIKAMKTPVLILVDEKQRLTMENVYNQYDGNQPVIFGDKNIFENGAVNVEAINTKAEYVADKLMNYKKEIWNEALTFMRNK